MKKVLAGLLMIVSINTLALETNLSIKRIVVDQMGREVRMSAENITPGEIVEYNFEIHNDSSLSEYELRPSIPIPDAMVLLEDKMDPGNFEVSVDGMTYMTYPVLDIEGNPIDPAAYKKVRWFIGEIKPQEIINVSLRARLND